MSAGLDLDALDQVSRTTLVTRKGTVRLTAHLASQGPNLTLNEARVMQLAAQGFTDQTIAGTLRTGLTTIEELLQSIYRKLDLDAVMDRRVSAVLWWVTR